MAISTLVAFAAAYFAFAASPGPDNMTIVARTLSNGAPSGIAQGVGTVTGVLIFLTLAAFGLLVACRSDGRADDDPALRRRSLSRMDGRQAVDGRGRGSGTATVSGARGLAAVFATGVALNLGNPKMPLFYIALLPNVVGGSLSFGQVGVLAAVIVAVEVVVIGGTSSWRAALASFCAAPASRVG